MLDVHHKGRAVVSSGPRERAELDVFRLHEHGLWATMEQSRDRHGGVSHATGTAASAPASRIPSAICCGCCPEQARELVDHDDPTAKRLFPVAYTDDDAAQADYHEMMGGSLLDHHQHALDVLVSTIDEPPSTSSDLHGWLGAVEVLRLLLGTQLDVSEDITEIDPGDPRADQFTVYQYLSMLQNEIVDTLADARCPGRAPPP